MYYCLGGKTPWHDAKNFVDIAYGVLQEQVDLSGLGISNDLRAVLAKAIAKDPDQRFGDATALDDALRQTPEWLSIRGDPSPDLYTRTRYFPRTTRRDNNDVAFLSALIVRWVSDEPDPGIVEVRLRDAEGKVWSFVNKYPVFFRQGSLNRDLTYPIRVEIACTVISRSGDLVTVSTTLPWGIEATDGTHEFVIRESQIIYHA